MPVTSIRDDYALWLASPPTTGLLVETLELNGPLLPSPILLVNRRSTPLQAIDENGVPRVFLPIAFTFSKPAIRNSSEYSSTARIDGLQGQLLKLLSRVTPADLTLSLYATLRLYVDPTMLDRPLYPQPLVFRVEDAKVTLDVVELTLIGGRMSTKRAGNYYIFERFEGLRPF